MREVHSRGAGDLTPVMCIGRSPRIRVVACRPRLPFSGPRSIPAYAGAIVSACSNSALQGTSPLVRVIAVERPALQVHGSFPLKRALFHLKRRRYEGRCIPASAGRSLPSGWRPWSDDPRTGGCFDLRPIPSWVTDGTFPLLRVSSHRHLRTCIHRWMIPACSGRVM
jgi:hypothetical protein